MPKAIGLYEDAEIYDILHADGTAAEVSALERIERRILGAGGAKTRMWLEPACGTGRYLRVAAMRGKQVIGFDRSAAMIEYARARIDRAAPGRGELFVGDMTRFAPPVRPSSVDLAFNLINTIRHLESDRAMLAHFRQVARVLRSRGVYVIGLSLSNYGNEFQTEDIWHGHRGRISVTQAVQYLPTSRRTSRWERVHSHLVITRSGQDEHRDSSYGLRCYDAEQWSALIGRSALRLAGVVDEAGKPSEVRGAGYLVFLLVRRDGGRSTAWPRQITRS